MTRISMTLAVASLTISLAPQVRATPVEPESATSSLVQISFPIKEERPEGVCATDITPVLAAALGLSAPQNTPQPPRIALACNAG